jgi:hypothetical protein
MIQYTKGGQLAGFLFLPHLNILELEVWLKQWSTYPV